MKQYIIRIDGQDMHKCDIHQSNIITHLKKSGLTIIKFVYSSFGDCLFIQVKGSYKGILNIVKIDTLVNDFDWVV